MNIQRTENDKQTETLCCGGPAPADATACCEKDALAKAAGEDGCGCEAEETCCDEPVQESQAGDSTTQDLIREQVRNQYTKVAESKSAGCGSSDSGCCNGSESDPENISQILGYSVDERSAVPEGANMGLGCGNPQAIAGLRPGETVVDLGSGGGFDCFLAARQVGDSGRVIGVDMTPAMISKSRINAEKAGFDYVEFRLGEIEALPVADSSTDVIISNCVLNLSPDKARVFAEAWRVLKPGGRLAIADIVAFAELPEQIRKDMALYSGCMAGASLISEIEALLQENGFTQIRILPKNESKSFIRDWAPDTPITDYVLSASIEAVKPVN